MELEKLYLLSLETTKGHNKEYMTFETGTWPLKLELWLHHFLFEEVMLGHLTSLSFIFLIKKIGIILVSPDLPYIFLLIALNSLLFKFNPFSPHSIPTKAGEDSKFLGGRHQILFSAFPYKTNNQWSSWLSNLVISFVCPYYQCIFHILMDLEKLQLK